MNRFWYILILLSAMIAHSTYAGPYNMGAFISTGTPVTVSGSKAFYNSGSTNNFTSPTPTATALDDLLLIVFEVDGGARAINVPAGWTAYGTTTTDSANAGTIYVYTKRAVAGDVGGSGSYSWSWTGTTYAGGIMWAIGGAAGIETYAKSTGTTTGSTLTSPTIFKSRNYELLIAYFHNNHSNTMTATAPLVQSDRINSTGTVGGHIIGGANSGGTSTAYTATGATDGSWQNLVFGIRGY